MMSQLAYRTDVVAMVALEQDQEMEVSQPKALDDYHLVRLKEYEIQMSKQRTAEAAADANLRGEQDEAWNAMENCSQLVNQTKADLEKWLQASAERESNFKAITLECYHKEFDERKILDLASLYQNSVTEEMTLNPKADLASVISNCDTAVNSFVLSEGGKWNQESQELWDKEHQNACSVGHEAYKNLIEEGSLAESHLSALIRKEEDEIKKDAYKEELKAARLKRTQGIAEQQRLYSEEVKLITERRQEDTKAIQETIHRLDRATGYSGPFDDEERNNEFLSIKEKFLEGICQVHQLRKALADEEEMEKEARLRYEACQKQMDMEKTPDGNQLQYEVMLRQVHDHFSKEDGNEVLASVTAEIDQNIAKLKEESLQEVNRFKEDTKEMKRVTNVSVKMSINEVAALTTRQGKMETQLAEVEGKLLNANAVRRVIWSADQKKLVEGISVTREQIAKFERDAADKKEKLTKDLEVLKREHTEKLHRINGDLAFWESAKEEFKNYEAIDDMETEVLEEEVKVDVIDKLNESLSSANLGDDPDPDDPGLQDISHLSDLAFNEPALRYILRFDQQGLREILTMMEQGNKNISSLRLKNRLVIGNVHYYICNKIEDLFDVDDECWGDRRHSADVKAVSGLPTGVGTRRQWTFKKNNRLDARIQRIAIYYPAVKLGIVRYHSKLEPEELEEKVRPPPRVLKKPDSAPIPMDVDTEPLDGLRRTDAPKEETEETYHATVAEPHLRDRDLILDAEILQQLIHEKLDDSELLIPARQFIEKPKAGDLYIFKTGEDPWADEECVKDDGMLFKHKKTEIQSNLFARRLYYTRLEGGSGGNVTAQFSKYMYLSLDNRHIAVHYCGDESFGVFKKRRYSRPQVIYRIRKAAAKYKDKKIRPVDLYRQLVSGSTSEGIAKEQTDPASLTAARLVTQKLNRTTAVARDDLSNAVITAQMSDSAYVRTVTATPTLRAVLCDSRALDEVNAMLNNTQNDVTFELHYDTTFDVQEKYLSTLSIRHTYIGLKEFEPGYRNRGAIIPLASLLHMTKSDFDHRLFFFQAREIVRGHCPRLLAANKVLCTDGEFVDIASDWPNTEQVLCWNHQRRNVIDYAEKQLSGKMNTDDLNAVNSDVYRFLCHKSPEAYENDRDKTLATADHWNTPLGQELKGYFLRTKDPIFKTHCCRYVLEAKGLTNVKNGITNNPAETLNSQLRHLKDKERILTADALILEMEKFENELNNEVKRAYYGVGRYELLENHQHLLRDKADLPSSYLQDVGVMRQAMKDMMVMQPTSHVEGAPPLSIHERGASKSRPLSSVQEHAKHFVENNMVSLVRGEGGAGNFWHVEGYGGSRHVVSLADNSCTCTLKQWCGHLVAARVVAGIQNDYSIPKGRTHSAVSRAKSIPTPGRRQSGYGAKKPSRTVLMSDTTHPPEALRTTVRFTDTTPTLDRYTPQHVKDNLGLRTVSPSPAKKRKDGPRTGDLRTQLFNKAIADACGETEDSQDAEELAFTILEPDPIVPALSGPHPALVASNLQRAGSKHKIPTPQLSLLEPTREVEASLNVLENQMQPGEIVRVKSEDGRQVLVKNEKEGHLVIYLDSEEDRAAWDLLETCSGMACLQASRSRKSRYLYELKIDIQCEAGQTKESLAFTAAPRRLDCKTVPMTCSCGKAAFEESPRSMKCTGCSRTFHRDCPGAFSDTLCKPCGGPFQGMVWSQTGNYTNTCAGDTVMTPMVDHSYYEDKMLLETMRNSKKMNPMDRDFTAACIRASNDCSNENLGEAHDTFMSAVVKLPTAGNKTGKGKGKTDCWMSVNEIYHEFNALNTFAKEKSCEGYGGQKCKSVLKATDQHTILLPVGMSSAAAMNEALNGVNPVTCNGGVCGSCARRTPRDESPPLVLEGPISIRDPQSPPALLAFECSGSISVQDAFKAPNELTISGNVYKKKYIAINRNDAHYFCHFRRGDLWITYDGMAPHRYHVTTPIQKFQLESEQGQYEYVEQICYFRSTHPKLKPQPGKSNKKSGM